MGPALIECLSQKSSGVGAELTRLCAVSLTQHSDHTTHSGRNSNPFFLSRIRRFISKTTQMQSLHSMFLTPDAQGLSSRAQAASHP